ncbi:MAG TPA: hypothetical protein VH306_05215 [Gaiellaceae bacterium]
MDAAAQVPVKPPGFVRILEHCELLDRADETTAQSARVRLESALGSELAGRLLTALADRRSRAALLV